MPFEHDNLEKDSMSQKPAKEGFVPRSTNSIRISDENLLDTMSQRYGKKIVGESNNIKTALCAIISRNLPKKFRFSLIILNQSSTGKSYFLNNILEPLKGTDDLIDFTDFTEAYLKRGISDLNEKIIKIEQLEKRDEKGQLSFHKLKHLLTEGVLRFGNVDNDDKGKRVAKTFTVKGYPVILTTATDSNIDPETQNRFLMMELDESEQQTDRIVKHMLDDYSKIIDDNEWSKDVEEIADVLQHLKEAGRMLVEDIKIPFADKIESMIPKNLTIRRDLSKILNLTCVIAFIHCKNRDKLVSKNVEHFPTNSFGECEEIRKGIIIAKPEDLKKAIQIAGNTINQTISKTTRNTKKFYAALKKIANEKTLDDQGVTLKDLIQKTGDPESTIRHHLNILREYGFIIVDYSQKEHTFMPLDKEFTKFTLNDIQFYDKEYKAWIDSILPDSYEFVTCPKNDDFTPKLDKKSRQKGVCEVL